MKRAMTLFVVIAALGLVFTGCKKKPAEKKADDTMAPAAMDEMMAAEGMDKMEPAMDAMDKMEPAMDAMGSAEGFGKIGVAECDAYLKVYSCYLSKMPAATQGAMKAAFKKTVEAYKKMASGPAKASLAKSCKMTMDAWKKAVVKNPKFADCFK